MARAPLPDRIPLATFFVLRWDRDAESMSIHIDDKARSSYDLGDDLPAVVRRLILWQVPPLFAARAVDTAREFGAAQVIPSQDRIINLIPRRVATNSVAEMLREIESTEGATYANLR